ncbi:MAG TPA: NAD-dependent epimerase/dehydratase family protein [Planctomycetota bacterium]|nr:NAD-dependent epimerase/dehydratase family protein [Planctomycetota bacterium]
MRPKLKRTRRAARKGQYALITGGCGFIGTNLADRLLSQGEEVLLYDNLSRAGVEKNLEWLRQEHGDLVGLVHADTRDPAALRSAVRGATKVFHFAAQVAVTTSLLDPVQDFEVNATGTLNLLEALRSVPEPVPLIFTSTNKVYGGLDDLAMLEKETRYEPVDLKLLSSGISERRVLDFHSPYGCSKGCADQYVIDYARTYDLPAAVFRMSCIYGPHQFGTEDQGWVAHFLIRAMQNERITLCGDGKQVRDILFVEDLVNAFVLAHDNIEEIAGSAFNIGGGPGQTVSLLELLSFIEELNGRKPDVSFDAWRTGDQRYYVSDTRKFAAATGWAPQVDVHEGVERLYRWLLEARSSVDNAPRARRNGHRRKRLTAVAEERA